MNNELKQKQSYIDLKADKSDVDDNIKNENIEGAQPG